LDEECFKLVDPRISGYIAITAEYKLMKIISTI
jgi:hypothetical protein